MDWGSGEQDPSEPMGRKKRFYRHTPQQIQELEAMFKVCPHPDEKQRMKLSRDLSLEPRQIKFWFQNRRTLMKAQHERADNCTLRAENDKIRCENIAMREALKNVICLSCGSGPANSNPYFDEQKLRMENARLKEEVDRVSDLTSKYLGRPITQLPPVQSISISQSEVSAGSYYNPGMGSSLDIGLLSRNPSSVLPYHYPAAPNSVLEKPIMMEMASSAMDEVIKLLQTNEPLWVKSGINGAEILQLETYQRNFQRPHHPLKYSDTRVESSRDSALVFMSTEMLVDMFMDASKWPELFPTIVSKARTIEVLAPGMQGTRSGSLILMNQELQAPSPIVPTREFCFLRYCQQIESGVWVIADVSVDYPMDNHLATSSVAWRLPSGCLIEEMANGYSKIRWVEHMEVADKNPIHVLFQDLINTGTGFGAHRWLSSLHRMSERIACHMAPGLSSRDTAGVPSAEAKRSMMKLAHRIVKTFCTTFNGSFGNKWTLMPGADDELRVTVHKTDSSQPNGVVLSAATSVWLPLPVERIFNFLKDEQNRTQWDILSSGNTMQRVAYFTNGSHSGNSISLISGMNAVHNMLILQESCTDPSGSMVAYSPINLPAMNVIMSGEDPSFVNLLPSGFTIIPESRSAMGRASTSSNPMGRYSGSVVTVAFQMLMGNIQAGTLNYESITTVSNLIDNTIQQIKSALNCPEI
ncbi:homeobox-leucine zipper protein ROC8-like [Canna indica]|uniref:Homeobox-leucine zipper protein ROC8-like n=1 Tax=Canna indica TaxID=4628 RepID=A0AAQ3QAR3_9LILI|nr:homeobox-leucine zipper protein ROC8-like [Canna indica]